ncbi:putative ribonuclease H-like domain-containing protein [Tanacetum coccineum]
MTHPHPKRSFVPQAVLTRAGKLSTAGITVNIVRPVNTANTKAVNTVRPVNTANTKAINTVRSVNTAASNPIGNPQQKEYKEKGVIDSGCSRHMTGNKCYLDEYEDYDGGFVSFGDGKGRISGKGKIKTGSLDFHDVYFCKELKYNLFSVSQICDKKNNVLFTDTECLVLSSNFKLLDESQVLLRVPRKDNIYSVDLKSVVPTGGLTCLIAKATVDESNTWHRRLGHINFKTMNKLVKGNLVKGLPSKIFENDHSCVACQKGKQHKASYKTKLVNSISKPLHMLHMDLFGPTNVKSLMKKSYCLVVTDDFSRFSWKTSTGRFHETFWVLVTILNTKDHLGKFDGKADEGFFVGFLENKPNVKGNRPDWLFDVDSLSISMNYVPVAAGNKTNGIVGTKDNIVADENKVLDKSGKHDQEARSVSERLNQREMQTEHTNSTNGINTVSTPVSTDGPSFDTAVPSTPINATGHFCLSSIGYYWPSLEIAYDDEDVEEEADMNNIDVKSAFLYGTLEEEVYVCQPPGFEDPQFPDKVYKVEKALYGLHQAPRAWYDTLSTYLIKNGFRRGTIDKTLFIKKDKGNILLVQVYVDDIIFGSTKKSLCDEFEGLMHKRFQMSSMGELTFFLGLQTTSTPMEPNKALVKDEEADSVDVHLYRSMIRSLMYLTASRPDITFAVCACARFQVTPKTSHLHAVKRIFRYLKGQPKLGLWYPRDSSFDLEAFSDSDYAGASLDRKSTTGGCQFLGKRLISWQCKKQTIVANSTTEAEYVAVANCCGQNPVFHSKTKHIEIKHHFIRDSYEKRLIQGRLMVYKCSGLYTSPIWIKVGRLKMLFGPVLRVKHGKKLVSADRLALCCWAKFWNTACLKTINSEKQIHANVDGKAVVVSESSVRRDLHLNDEDGTACLTTNEIFENLALMGYEPASDKLTFYKGLFSPQWKYLIHTILHCLSLKSTSWDQFSTNLASAIICLAKGQKFNFSKLIFDGKGFSGRVTPLFHNMLVPPVVVGKGSEQPPEPQPTPSNAPPEVRSQVTTVSGGSPNKVGDEAINEDMFDSVERAATTASSLEAEQASGSVPWCQETMGGMQAQTRSESVSNLSSDPPLSGGHTLRIGKDNMEHQIKLTNNVPNTPHDSPLLGVNTPRSDEGSLELNELMDLVTKLSHRVFDLEKVKTAQAKEIAGLKRRVTKLEQRQRSRILKNHPFRFGSSRRQSLGKKDVSKQGRKHLKTQLQFGEDAFDDIDDLVDEGMAFVQEKDAENQGKIGADDTEVVKGSGDTEVLDTEKAVNTAGEGVSTASVPETVSTAAPRTPPTTTTVFDDEDVTMAMAQTLIKMKEEKAKEKGVVIKDVEDSSRLVRSITTIQPLPTIDPKDKGKGILQETESVDKTKKKVQGDAKMERDAKVTLRLQAELDEELRVERERQEEASKVVIAEMFDKVQARMDADYELAAKMTQDKQQKYTIEERARLLAEFFKKRKKQLAAERAEAIRNKPPTKTQLYERQQKRIQDFTPMDSKKEAQKPEEEAAEYEKEKEELRANKSSSYHGDTQAFLRRLDRQDLNDLYSCKVHTLFMDGILMEINMLVEKKYPLINELLEKMLNLQLEAEEEITMAFELIKFIKSLLEE